MVKDANKKAKLRKIFKKGVINVSVNTSVGQNQNPGASKLSKMFSTIQSSKLNVSMRNSSVDKKSTIRRK